MNFKIQISKKSKSEAKIFLINKESQLKDLLQDDISIKKIKSLLSDNNKTVSYFNNGELIIVAKISKDLESNRISANTCFKYLMDFKIKDLSISSQEDELHNESFIEGLLLSTYTFNKYKSDAKESVLNISLDKEVLFKDIPTKLDDKTFAHTESSVANNIRKSFLNIPPALIDSNDSSLFGNSGESLREMRLFYQEQTDFIREEIAEVFEDVFENFRKEINVSADWTVKKLVKDAELTGRLNNEYKNAIKEELEKCNKIKSFISKVRLLADHTWDILEED